MLGLSLSPAHGPLRILALGAHSDDIEIGCGATLLALAAQHESIELCWAVATGDETREAEARSSAADFAGNHTYTCVFGGLRESYLPAQWETTKAFVHSVANQFDPHVVFTHALHDQHQDHRTLAELVPNAFRNHLVLGFEIPKYEGDLKPPSVFFEVSAEHANRKVELLHRHFPSQATKYWFDSQMFLGLMRIRGVEARAESGFAEAFHASKINLRS
jgi:LmbE family N-acetylglucosaminyl deacetylase